MRFQSGTFQSDSFENLKSACFVTRSMSLLNLFKIDSLEKDSFLNPLDDFGDEFSKSVAHFWNFSK